MKTIFRYANVGLLAGAILATGAMAAFAQDACADADGQTKLGDQFRAEYAAGKDPVNRRKAVATGKSFLEKYGSCEPAKELSDYLKNQIPKMEKAIQDAEALDAKNKLVARFDGALKAKNWDEVYAAGKEVLTKYPEDFRVVEIVLGSVGGEEAFKTNAKYNDDALRFAKQSIADLEAGKTFKVGDKESYGLSLANTYNFEFKDRNDAIAWMNLYIGYITGVSQKNKTAALPYFYKATQATGSDASKNPVSYDLIGSYYIDELNKVYDEIQALAKTQSDTDAPEVAQKKVDDIKAKVALANGIAERAMDAYARANKLSTDAAFKTRTRTTLEAVYKRRFDKTEGVDTWIASTVAKPFVNPATPVQPISDPEPAKTATGTTAAPGAGAANGTGVGAANGTGVGAANGTGVGGVKPSAPAKTAPAPTKPKNR